MPPSTQKAITNNRNADLAAVDLFCGAGGLTYGLERAGINVVLGVDINESCRYPMETNTNARFLQSDVSKIKSNILIEAWGQSKYRILAGCAPCQPFSTYTQGRLTESDPRWSLLHSFANLIEQTHPELVTMENVAKLAGHQVFEQFLSVLDKAKYEVTWDILDCRLYGIPQSRRRLVLIASKLGKPHLPEPTTPNVLQWKTVKQAIGSLPRLAAGEANQQDPYHVSSSLSDTNLKRIKASKPGGTWRDWPIDLITSCHKKKSGKTYPAVYGRMEWDRPAPTITGQCFGFGNGRFGHPEQDRAISLREAAILQSFPRKYAFASRKDEIYITSAGLMIGNAVPPKLAEAIGKAIVKHIQNANH